MAGSLAHIVNEETGEFEMDAIGNMGDAHEALEECFYLISAMTGGSMETINSYCEALDYPPIDHDMAMPSEGS